MFQKPSKASYSFNDSKWKKMEFFCNKKNYQDY